jgi:septation ring formation regulator EzrA
MSDSIEAMLARIDERTSRIDKSVNDLWEVANDSRDKISKMEGANVNSRTDAAENDIRDVTGRLTKLETVVAPLYAGMAAVFSIVVGFVLDIFKGSGS